MRGRTVGSAGSCSRLSPPTSAGTAVAVTAAALAPAAQPWTRSSCSDPGPQARAAAPALSALR